MGGDTFETQINNKTSEIDKTNCEMLQPGTNSDTSCCLYRQLGENEIRLLEIHPLSEQNTVEYRLKSTKLGDITDYSVLSYTWGDLTKPKVAISINGQSLYVTQNCHLALEELSHEVIAQSNTHLIWIDAICINQEDISERNRQILTMRNVYLRSKKLVVWLGVEADGSGEFIETMKAIAGCSSKHGSQQWRESYEKHLRCPNRGLSMILFFSRPWFTRVWVIQEYVLCAQRSIENRRSIAVEFYCGKSRVPSNVLGRIIKVDFEAFILPLLAQARREIAEERRNSLLIPFSKGIRCFLYMVRSSDNIFYPTFQNHASTVLLRHILAGSDFQATDPRDRIYAHLGLISYLRSDSMRLKGLQFFGKRSGANVGLNEEGIRLGAYLESSSEIAEQARANFPNLIIDYDASIEDIYSSFVLNMVSSTGNLNILSLCFRRSEDIKRTWTVDFTNLSQFEDIDRKGSLLMESLSLGKRSDLFCASKGTTGWIARFSSNLSELTVRGLQVATITLLLDTGDLSPHSGQIVFYKKHMVQEVSNFLVWTGVCKTYGAARRLLWKTWIGGVSQDCPGMFDEWCALLDNGFIGLPLESIEDSWYDIIFRQPSRTIFTMDNMMLGKGWNTVKEGDYVCVILGCDVPLVLRPVANHFELIGDCYIDGIMEGQAMQNLGKSKDEVRIFNIH